ncbi:synaptotagmin-4-like [Patiria miniata]|uniref:C2 domain-containing protein n=1 Tax=Patiria miniata TaxID=46514 RepID=A0A914BDR1_PATMI|nr:synaptotagmin-4-like [Patiria miniata]
MATSGVVVVLGVLCGVFVIILILVAVFICRRILRRRKKLKLRDEMEINRLLVDEIMSNGDFTGASAIAETIILPAQQEVVDRGDCGGGVRDGILSHEAHQEVSACLTTDELSTPPSTPSHKVSIKQRLYRKRTKSIASGSGDASLLAPSMKPPTSINQPLRVRSKSMNNLMLFSTPNNPGLIRFGSHLSLDDESDSSEVFSYSISAPPSPATRSEAEETGEDTQQGEDRKRRKSSKGSKSPVRIRLEYSIYYSSAESTLVISMKGVTGIPNKYGPTCASFVRVYLSPKTSRGYLQTCTVRRTLEPMYNDQLQFRKISLEEVWVKSLRFKLYVKGQWGGHHESLAEASRHCATLIREADEVYEISEVLKLKRSKWMQRSHTVPALQLTEPHPPVDDIHPASKLQTPQGLGDLFVSIQYQYTASRFKVMVRKADHLSTGINLLGTPSSVAHYIGVNLLRKEQAVVQSETTRSLAGSQPTWNQPFLLHLSPSRELTDYCIEFLLMRVRFHSGGRVPIGRMMVGPKVEGTGGLHWDEVMLPRLTEVTRWHTFQPI